MLHNLHVLYKLPFREDKYIQLTLDKASQHLTTSLQQWMTNNNLQEPLQSLPPMLNHIIAKPVREDLSWQRRNRDSRRLALQNVAEVLEVGIASADRGMAQLESGDVGSAEYLVVGVHVAAHAVGARVAYLEGEVSEAAEVRGGELR